MIHQPQDEQLTSTHSHACSFPPPSSHPNPPILRHSPMTTNDQHDITTSACEHDGRMFTFQSFNKIAIHIAIHRSFKTVLNISPRFRHISTPKIVITPTSYSCLLAAPSFSIPSHPAALPANSSTLPNPSRLASRCWLAAFIASIPSSLSF